MSYIFHVYPDSSVYDNIQRVYININAPKVSNVNKSCCDSDRHKDLYVIIYNLWSSL